MTNPSPALPSAAVAPDLCAKAPWYVSGVRTRHNSMPVLQIISEPAGEVLALVPYSDRTPKQHAECYADAHLIAAAPELLEALKWAERAIAPFSKDPAEKSGMAMIRAAIAKAERP